MTRTRLVRLALVLVVTGVALVATPTGARAATIEQQGWWYRLRPAGLADVLPPRPDVEAGQLVVEGAPDGAVALSALRFRLDEGETNPALTVTVADFVGAPETTVVLACAAEVGWQPVEGGEWENRPVPDCTTSVEGSPSADGTSWTFAVSALAEESTLDIVLVPGKVPNGLDPVSGSTFRLVLETPSLTTTGDGAAAMPSLPPLSTGGSTGTAGAAPSFAGGSPAGGAGSVATPALPGAPSTPGPATSAPQASQSAIAPPSVPAAAEGTERARWLGIVVLVAGALLALLADRLPGAVTGDDSMGGLGRFARLRSGPPPRLV